MSKEYYVRIETTTWVYVDAENEDEAKELAYDAAFTMPADELNAVILDVSEEE